MVTIEELKLNSVNYIVATLVAIGRIYEFTVRGGERKVKVIQNDGRRVELCRFGNGCYTHNCRFHHVHCDIRKIYEDYELCPDYGSCVDSDCPYRHPDRIGTLIRDTNQYLIDHPDDYQKFVIFLSHMYDMDWIESEIQDQVIDDGSQDPDNVIPDHMMPNMIINAHQTGNFGLLDNLDDVGYNVYN